MESKKVIAIVGPTGSGKTIWAKKIADKFMGKIISVDSRQVYRGMDIGTAKEKEIQQGLIDIVNPDEPYSVADFQKGAVDLINQYMKMKNLPILVGGTGLYMEAVLYGYVLPELKAQSDEIKKDLEKLSDAALYSKLQKLDPKAAENIDPRNVRRVMRALEVTMLTGEPFSSQKRKRKPIYDALIIGIKTDRDTLYSKIDARVDKMITEGLVEEVRKLIQRYNQNLPAFNTIGYREIIDYINGKQTLKVAIEKIKNNTHAYVRKQDTWFSHDKNIYWVTDLKQAEKLVEKFLKK